MNEGQLPRRPNLKHEVAMHVRELILSGQLKASDKINQGKIAERLQVSRLPVREALITLEGEGLVEIIPRRGAFVAGLTPHDVLDHYTIYGLLSGLAARRAATNLTDDHLKELREICDAMDETEDLHLHSSLNYEFHRSINKAGGTHRLLSVLTLMASNIPEHFFDFTLDWTQQAAADHRKILTMLEARDDAGAAQAMEDHLHNSGEYAVRSLETVGFWRAQEELD